MRAKWITVEKHKKWKHTPFPGCRCNRPFCKLAECLCIWIFSAQTYEYSDGLVHLLCLTYCSQYLLLVQVSMVLPIVKVMWPFHRQEYLFFFVLQKSFHLLKSAQVSLFSCQVTNFCFFFLHKSSLNLPLYCTISGKNLPFTEVIYTHVYVHVVLSCRHCCKYKGYSSIVHSYLLSRVEQYLMRGYEDTSLIIFPEIFRKYMLWVLVRIFHMEALPITTHSICMVE